jgi:hypothetical protein
MIACALNAFGIEPAFSEGEPSQGSPSPPGEPLLPV